MKQLVAKIESLKKSEVGRKVRSRMKAFEAMRSKPGEEWFSELCFCILTANAKSRTAIAVQSELGHKGFMQLSHAALVRNLLKNKHRFHNTKAERIIKAREWKGIKRILSSMDDPRPWLVENIHGYGWKEASHFLRNVGYTDYAIIDRHVLNILKENKILQEIPKSIPPKKYLSIEKELKKVADAVNLSQAELDLYLWYMKGGDVLK